MTTSSPPEDRVDWSGMLGELLTCVSQLLDVPTRVCFRATCRSWREAADDVKDRPAAVTMPPPWVVVPGDIGCSKSFTLLSVPTRQSFRWTPPGGLGLRCVGSNGSWLAGAYVANDQTVRIALVNPLTGALVEAPPYGRFSFLPDPEGQKAQVEAGLSDAVTKVAFSPNPTAQDFAVAVVSRTPSSCNVVVYRAGCDDWCAVAALPDGEHDGHSARVDLAYRDGKFYYMTCVGGQVWVVDMAAPCPAAARLAMFPAATTPYGRRRRYHLAFSGDGALHVVSSSEDTSLRSPRVDVLAQRHDPSGLSDRSPSTSWKQAGLRGQAFLVGDFNQTLCAPVRDGGGDGVWLRPESVYFAGVPLCSALAEWYRSYYDHEIGRREGVGVWRFDLITGNFQRPASIRKIRLRPPLEFWKPAWSRHKDELLEDETWNRLDWSKAIWFMPSMR